MPLSEGAVVFDRFRLTQRLDAPQHVERWAVVDTTDSSRAELWLPTKLASMWPNAENAARGAGIGADHPGVLAPLLQGTADDRPAVIRPPVQGTMAQPKLTPEQVPALAGWLAGAIEASGWSGTFTGGDVVICPEGIPRLAPRGLSANPSIARVPHATAPEVLDGAAPSSSAALYGLGVWLFHGLTGTYPVDARTRATLRAGQASPRAIQTVRPEVPDEVAAIIAQLLDPDPSRRHGAAPDAGPPAAVTFTPKQKPQQAARPAVRRAIAAPIRQSRHAIRAVVDPADLTSDQRARLAALTGMSMSTLADLAARGAPVSVGGGRTREEAEAAGALAERIGLPVRIADLPSGALPLAVTAMGGLAGVVLAIGGVIALPTAFLVGAGLLIGAGISALVAMGALVLAVGRLGRRRNLRRADRAGGETSPLLAELRQAHRAVLEADLARPIQIDLEHELNALAAAVDQNQLTEEDIREALRDISGVVAAYEMTERAAPIESTDDARNAARAARAALQETGRTPSS